MERNEPVKGANVYYRGPGDQTKIMDIPQGMQLIATPSRWLIVQRRQMHRQRKTCRDTPPYGCRTDWTTRSSSPSAATEASGERGH